ncbi:MMPL family transporter [bacterium]|nr:MMPL family transporter [bacterium]
MKQTIFNKKLANIGMNGIVRFRFFWLAFVTLIVVVCGFGLSDLSLDSSNESFLPKSDDLYLANEQFKEQFGNEEFVFILIETGDLFSFKTLQRIRALQTDLEARLPFVDDVNTISSVEFMETIGDNLVIDKIIGDELPTTGEQFEEVKRKLASSRLYLNRIVTSDWKHVGIAVTLERMPSSVWVKADKGFTPMDQVNWPDEKIIMSDGIHGEKPNSDTSGLVEVVDPRKLIAPALKAILKDHQADDFNLKATGMPIGDFEVDQITTEEGSKLGLIAFGAAFLFMLFLFRNPIGVFAPMAVMVSTVVILFGMMGWLGVPVSMGSMFVAPLLMVLSVSYSIHYINHFNFHFQRKGNRRDALYYAYEQSSWPCFLTALTTAIGFASFLIVSMKPIRDVGITCGSGAIISFLLVMILVPIFYSFGKTSREQKVNDSDDKKPHPWGMAPLSQWVLRLKIPTIVFSILVIVFGTVYFRSIPVETDLLKLLGPRNSFVKDSKSITDVLGGYYSYEVMIELPEKEAAKKPAILMAVELLSIEAQQWESTKTTMSLVDLVKEINFVMNGRRPEYYVIPDSREKIAQYLLLYEISGGGELDNWVDYNYKKLRLSVQLADSANLDRHIDQMKAIAKNLFPKDTRISIVGDVPILLRLMNLLTIGQLKSILMAFAVICLVMITILRSIKAGIISMIPNVFPLFVLAGLMGLLQINLDIMTIMIAPMIIGIAVDDTVHFFIHFKEELSELNDYQRANRQTFIKIGHALLFTSIVLSLGFGILGFSNVDGIVSMGFLATIGIISALIADFFITPILLVYLKPFGRFQEEPKRSMIPDQEQELNLP